MDGVLFDSNELGQRSMAQQFPGLTPEMQREMLCGNFHDAIAQIKLPRLAETAEEREARKVRYARDKAEVAMYPGAKELLEDLHARGHLLVLNTSAIDRNCLPLLERRGITGLFDLLATAELSKSKVEKFKMVEEKYGVAAADMVFVTDTLGDLREADTAGVPTVAVTWGAHDRSFFEREEHSNLLDIVDTFPALETHLV